MRPQPNRRPRTGPSQGRSPLRTRSGVQTAANRHRSFVSTFPDARRDSPRGHLEWTKRREGTEEILFTVLDPRTGQEAGYVRYRLERNRLVVSELFVAGRYRQSDCLLALLAELDQQRLPLETALELEGRIERLFRARAARHRRSRLKRLQERVLGFLHLARS